ncbi:MAG: hypothetical protein ACJ8G1_22995 [Vitreoscilla sp.]
MPKPAKFEKLLAVYDRFHAELEVVDHEFARQLVAAWKAGRASVVTPEPGVRPSQLAADMEEGLRFFMSASMSASDGARVARALRAAIADAYPEFIAQQDETLRAICAKGRIASDRQFDLVRHAIDVAEGDPRRREQLAELYRLVELYESRARRR